MVTVGSIVADMTENQSRGHDPRRRDWDAAYREKNRDRRRAYDRARMRQMREAAERAEGGDAA